MYDIFIINLIIFLFLMFLYPFGSHLLSLTSFSIPVTFLFIHNAR